MPRSRPPDLARSTLGKVVLPALVSPLLAGVVAFAATRAAYRLTARARGATVNRAFKFGQVVRASIRLGALGGVAGRLALVWMVDLPVPPLAQTAA